jgi:alanine or glycine:cation symporter, AGCS family
MFLDSLDAWLDQVGGWIWGPVLVGLLIGTGVYFTILLRGIQFRHIGRALRLTFSRSKARGEGDITPFQALTTALSATVGTGNIAGVATAVVIGGVGAVFWIWVSGVVGMALKYAEACLSVRFRTVTGRHEMAGGPMYYIQNALSWKWLAVLYALFGLLASLGVGNMVQAHSIADVLDATIGIPRLVTGVVLAVVLGVVILGGIKRIGRVTSILIPAMALFYLLAGIAVLVVQWRHVPGAIGMIFDAAFTGQAAVGGFLGSSAILAMRIGVARGIFSNEAGMGTAGIAAAAAKTEEPGRQALIAMVGPFIDTIVVCTVTGLVLAVTGVLGTVLPDGSLLNGAPLTALAFGSSLPGGSGMVALGLVFFAYSTIIGWAYYGEKLLEFLAGERFRLAYRLFFCLLVIGGALLPLQTVWSFADIANGLMALCNLVGLIGLAGIVVSETRIYLGGKRAVSD